MFKDVGFIELLVVICVVCDGDFVVVLLVICCFIERFIFCQGEGVVIIIDLKFVEIFLDWECEVFICVGEGFMNVEIVEWFYLVEMIVKIYIGYILLKLGLCDCVFMVIMVYDVGLVCLGC